MSSKNVTSLLATIFTMQMMLDPYGEFLDLDELIDRNIEYDPKAEDVKFHMNLELIRLLNEGYTEDEILEIVNTLDVKGLKELSEPKQEYVRDETRKLVLKRKERLLYE